MPEGVLLDPAYAGMSAEEIYDRLPQDAGGDGDSDDPGGMGGVSDPPPGGEIPGEPGAGAPSAADLARQEETWSIATAQAEATAKAMGLGAGDTARVLREQVAPKARLARGAAPLSLRRGQVRLRLDPAQPALYRPRALSALAAQREPRPGGHRRRYQRQHRRRDTRRLLGRDHRHHGRGGARGDPRGLLRRCGRRHRDL